MDIYGGFSKRMGTFIHNLRGINYAPINYSRIRLPVLFLFSTVFPVTNRQFALKVSEFDEDETSKRDRERKNVVHNE